MTEQSITKQVKKYKLVFIGDQSVGKTSIINRFIYDNFVGTQQPTVGIDFVAKTLHIDNKTIRLQLWDTAGQERFRSLIPSYIRDSNAAILVYDVTSIQSFQSLSKWIEYVKEERGEEVLSIILANKVDLDNRQVSKEEGEKFAQQANVMFFEVSAKSGDGISNVFKQISQQLLNGDKSDQSPYDIPQTQINDQQKQKDTGNGNIQLTQNAETKEKKGCC